LIQGIVEFSTLGSVLQKVEGFSVPADVSGVQDHIRGIPESHLKLIYKGPSDFMIISLLENTTTQAKEGEILVNCFEIMIPRLIEEHHIVDQGPSFVSKRPVDLRGSPGYHLHLFCQTERNAGRPATPRDRVHFLEVEQHLSVSRYSLLLCPLYPLQQLLGAAARRSGSGAQHAGQFLDSLLLG